MKKVLWSVLILIALLLIFGLGSCTLIDGDDTPQARFSIEAGFLSGNIWEVTLFERGGKDHSTEYRKVFLEFFPDNYLLVTDSACDTQEGEWVLSADSTLLVIRLKNDYWKDLDDEWVVTLMDDNQLRIIDNDGQEEFHFIAVDAIDVQCHNCDDLTDILTDGPWIVDYYGRGDTVGTQLFSRFYFRFTGDGEFLIKCKESEIWGTWRVIGNCNKIKIAIDEEIFPHSIMNEDWFILEFTKREIILRDERSNVIEELHLKRGLPPKECLESKGILYKDLWHIQSFSVNNNADIAREFAGLSFNFLPGDSVMIIPGAGDTWFGNWNVEGEECEFINLDLAESGSFEELSRRWFVKKLTNDLVILVHEVGTIRFELRLVKGPAVQLAECEDLAEILLATEWEISFFEEDESTETEEFGDFELKFKEDGTLEVAKKDDLMSGTWRLPGGCEKLALEIEGTGKLNEINQVWIIVEINDEKIKMVYEDNNHRKEMHLKAK